MHNEDEGHYSAVMASDNPNKNFTMLNNVKRYVDSNEVQKKNNVQDKSRRDQKNEKDKIDSLMMRLGVLESRMNFYEAEKKRNDEENQKLREKIDALKAYTCSHQPVAQQPVISDTNQSNLFPQPGQVIPPPVVFMDTTEKEDEFEDLNRLKALKEKGFRRDTPQTKPVEKSVPKKPTFYCISCNVSFDTKDTLKEHNQVCKSKKTPDFEPVKPPERVYKIPVLQSDVNVKAVHPGFVPRQYNCHECGFQSSGSGRSKMLLRHARETGHRTDDLSEKCFTCGTVSKNFVELMTHRKTQHRDIVQKCHYNQDCQFKEKCWYNHDSGSNPSLVKNNGIQEDFQQVKESLPPDQVVLLKELLTLFQQSKGSKQGQGKSPGA